MTIISPDTRTAIVLFNLGGPDALQAVEPFLFNLFNDPAIIRVPGLFRRFLAKLISSKRAPVAQEIYEKMGGGSPILPNTQAQAQALEAALSNHGQVKCFIAMRYWHPRAAEMVKQVADYAPDHVILLPLYPQFSTTTTASSLKEWQEECAKNGYDWPTSAICCYPTQEGFIDSEVTLLRQAYAEASAHGIPRILFSAHGLPEKIVTAGDPYQWQVEQTAAAILKKLDLTPTDAVVCYQSRVGPMKWIGPSTPDEITRAANEAKPIILVPLAFVSEHSETLVELDIEYAHLAEKSPIYVRVPTVSVQKHFIEGLAQLCLGVKPGTSICSAQGGRICPKQFTGCPHRIKEVA